MAYDRDARGWWIAILVSLPFIGSGAWLVLAPPTDATLPPWAFGCIGVALGGPGLLLVALGVALRRRWLRNRLAGAVEPWFADHAWDPRGAACGLGAEAVTGFVLAAYVAVLFAPLLWWAWFSGRGGTPSRVGAGVLTLVVLVAVGRAIRDLVRWVRFGRVRLRFRSFPFEPGRSVDVVLTPNRFARLRATLVCTRTYVGPHDDLEAPVERAVLFEATQEIRPRAGEPDVVIRFDLPAEDGWASAYSGMPKRAWTLTAEADGFRATWHLPVYPRPAAAPRLSPASVRS